MERDVFISYSSVDKHVADAICSTLENSAIRCWIAPRDIIPGSDWAQSIINGIKSSKLMVLVFSHNSNGSSQVTKELNLAVSNNLIIMPFKIDDSMPSGSMEYYLADMHWLDAIDGDMQDQINNLRDIIKKVITPDFKEDSDSPVEEASDSLPKDEPDEKTEIITFEQAAREYVKAAKDVNSSVRRMIWKSYYLLWKNCFVYKGCASKYEFWFTALMAFAITQILMMFGGVAFPGDATYFGLLGAYVCLSIVPFISLGVRRLHDTNRSGHWMWLCLTGVGIIVLVVFFCFTTADKNNRFKKCQ